MNANNRKRTDILAFNEQAERKLCLLLDELLEELQATEDTGGVPVQTVYQEAAFELSISVETAKRYLWKYTARRAPYQVVDGYVYARP